jgi:hypothetical protein
MSTKLFPTTRLVCAAIFCILLAGMTARAGDGLKMEAELVLGTNEAQTNATPVSPQIERKLKKLPLKWGTYFVIGSQQFSVKKNESTAVNLGSEPQFYVANLGEEKVEVTLTGKGEIKQSLKKGQILVVNGSAENTLVVLRQAD